MIRVPAILLILVQAIQGLALPHSHAAVAEPADHARRPHLHLGLGHHHHDHDDEHHHHHDGLPPETEAAPGEIPLSDHDRDAFYLSADQALPGRAGLSFNPEFWQELTLLSVVLPAQAALPPAVAPPESLPPPVCAGRFRCPLYLQTLALLI